MQTRPTELQSITSRVGDGSGHGNDDDAAMDVLGAWEICGEGEREGVGGWDRGVGAWRPYPLPALSARGCGGDQAPVATWSRE